MKNYGLDLDLEKSHQSEEDEVFGAFSSMCLAVIPEVEREHYLPEGEVQKGAEDTMDCASRGPINILETKFNWLWRNNKICPENKEWLKMNGYVHNDSVTFSDAFIAIKSGTTRGGNSLKAPLHAIHEYGLIPKHRLPLEPTMTWGDYHNPERITRELEKLGEEFKSRFPIRYAKVFRNHFTELYKEDVLDLAGYAWSEPVLGIYPKSGNQPNHVFMGIKRPTHTIFDNYIDVVDNDFIKRLSSDYDLLDYGYRVYITGDIIPTLKLLGYWQKFLKLCTNF